MKKMMYAAVLFSLLFFVTACSGESMNESSGNSDDENGGDNSDSSTITVWYYFTGNQEELFVDLIDQYNESQDEVEVEGEYVPFDEIKKQLSVGVAGGTLPDMVFLDNVDNASFADMDVLEEISSRVEEWDKSDSFYEGPINSASLNDGLYGLPYTSNTLGLFYNEDMLSEAGVEEPPSTWDELKETAGELTNDQHKGFALSAIKSEEGTFQYYPFLLSSGVDYTELGSEEAISSMSLLNDLLNDGSMDEGVLNATQDDLARQFAQGQVAMMINGTWNINRLQEENPDLNFSIAQIPKDEEHASALGGVNLSIVKDGNVEGSWEFMQWLYEDERYEKYTSETGVFPARKDILEGSDYWSDDEYLNNFVPIMDDAHARGPSPEWPSISEAIQIALQETLTQEKTPEEAMNQADEEVNNIIKE